jgi:isopentenyldiphosphate isomerase
VAELIDVLTGDGAETGKRKPKPSIHRDGDWHRAVHLWILTPDGEVLLQRRSLSKENFPGLWDVSVAGHISAGEPAVAAAVRESLEELSLPLDAGHLRQIATLRESWVLNGGTYIDNEIHDVFLVRRSIDIGMLRPDPEEVGGVALVSLDDFRERVTRRDPTLVPHWEEYEMLLISAAVR